MASEVKVAGSILAKRIFGDVLFECGVVRFSRCGILPLLMRLSKGGESTGRKIAPIDSINVRILDITARNF